jgi:hypothetical protein
VAERLAERQLGEMAGNPLALAALLCSAIAPRLALDVMADDVSKRRPRPRQILGQCVDLPVHLIAQDELLARVEHRQAARHVVEGHIEPQIDPVDLLGLRSSGA